MRPAVPREHMGLARQLRRDLTAAGEASRMMVDEVLAPIRRGLRRRGTIRDEEIRGSLRQWKMAMPPANRVSLTIAMRGGQAFIQNVFFLSAELNRPGWGHTGWEPGIVMTAATVRLGRRICQMEERDLFAFSLHSIGRRFERGASVEDRRTGAVMRDLCATAAHNPDSLLDGTPVTLPAGFGSWIGETVAIDGKRVSLIRTYIDADMAP